MPQTDEELMAQYQEGSEEALRILFSRHSGKVFGYLKAQTKSDSEASDLFQEVFIKIHRSKHLYKKSLPLLPWIFSVTRSVLIDGQRKKARKKEVFGYDFDQIPHEPLEESHLVAVAPLMDRLPIQQSAAIQMRYVDEKTFEEIAESLKTSPLNVRKIVSRGIQNLRRLLVEGEKP